MNVLLLLFWLTRCCGVCYVVVLIADLVNGLYDLKDCTYVMIRIE